MFPALSVAAPLLRHDCSPCLAKIFVFHFLADYYVEGDKCPTYFYRYDDRTSFGNFAFYENDKGSTAFTATKAGVMNEVGRLVIFPSSMVHDVDTNESDKDRVTISFNTFIKGEMGEPENSNHLII